MSSFGFGISGLYKSELIFFFCIFGCLYRERYCFSYSFISSCFALRFALTYLPRVNVPRSTSRCVQDVDFFTPDFGCLYRERYFCSYSFRSFFMSSFGFGISGLYKSELVLFFCGFGCLYRERYCLSYSFIVVLSSCLAFCVLTYLPRVNVPKSRSRCVQDVDFFTPGFGCLYREIYCSARILLSSSCLHVLRFTLTYWRRVNVSKSVLCFKLDDLSFTPDFGSLYRREVLFFVFSYLVLFCFTFCIDVLTEELTCLNQYRVSN